MIRISKNNNQIVPKIGSLLITLFVTLVLAFTLTGDNQPLNNQYFENPETLGLGHFENSPPRARFALTYAIAEQKTTILNTSLAKFSTPDLAKSGDNYVSLFAPGPSVVVIPGFIVGKALGSAQTGAFAVVSVFALLNFLLIRAISIKVGANKFAATLGALTYLIATPALVYAGVLYQHHMSVFLILAGIYSLYRFKPFTALSIVWFLCGASIVIDNPNLFMMAPVGIAALGKILYLETDGKTKKINFKPVLLLTFVTILIPIGAFLYYNQLTFGNKFQLAGTLTSVASIEVSKDHAKEQAQVNSQKLLEVEGANASDKDAVGFFNTRDILNGMFIHTISPDRGVLFYTPVILLGLFGIPILYRKKEPLLALLVSVLAMNFVIYSMWGDPWGGWAFGSRYLIPGYAILAIFLSAALTHYKKNIFFGVIYVGLLAFSIKTNVLGAITTNSMPPKIQVLDLESKSGLIEHYTPKRGYDYLNRNDTRSYIYNEYLSKQMTAWDYYHNLMYATVTLLCLFAGLYFFSSFKVKKKG
jgi:hypothetical protein